MTAAKSGPAVQVDVDLDALRKAHADGRRTKTFRAAGRVYSVAGRLPIYVAALLAEGEIRQSLRLWLGDEQEKHFAAEVGCDDDELKVLLENLYNESLGESGASSES